MKNGAFFVSIGGILLSLSTLAKSRPAGRNLRFPSVLVEHDSYQTITCKIEVIAAVLDLLVGEDESSTKHEFYCIHAHGVVYGITGFTSRLFGHANHEVSLDPVVVNELDMTVYIDANVTIKEASAGHSHRDLQELPFAIGNRSVLAVRVSFLDKQPSYSADRLSDVLFGDDNGSITLRSQYGACSFGKLNLIPANGANIIKGVAEIFVRRNTSEMTRFYAEQTARDEAEHLLGEIEDEIDHILFCMPPGIRYDDSREEWAAYAYVGSGLSFYNDVNCLYVSGKIIHEDEMELLKEYTLKQ